MRGEPAEPLGSPRLENILQNVAWSLGIKRCDPWRDDMLQAARIRLWRTPSTLLGHQIQAATRAMQDEMRRVTPGARTIVQGVRGQHRPMFCALSHHRQHPLSPDCPESAAAAMQCLRRLQAAFPGWPEALAETDTLAAAGARMGVTESRACQVRCAMRVAANAEQAAEQTRNTLQTVSAC